jgi:hypothetical protein
MPSSLRASPWEARISDFRASSERPVLEGAVEHPSEGLGAERFERDHAAAGEERGDDAERGVLRRRADQRDRASLDVGEQRVLLRLVQAVDLVDEEQRAQSRPARGLDRLADLGHPRRHRRERYEPGIRLLAEDPGQRRLAAAGGTPEDDRGQRAPLEQGVQRPPGGEERLVADHVLEAARAHALRERRVGLEAALRLRLEEVERVVGGRHGASVAAHVGFGLAGERDGSGRDRTDPDSLRRGRPVLRAPPRIGIMHGARDGGSGLPAAVGGQRGEASMIEVLRIENLALVESVELEFGSGLNVLTGETGAGKSIILSALALLTGGRASAETLRSGADEGAVEALFRMDGHEDVAVALEARGLADATEEVDGEAPELIVRRTLHAGGRSRARVGGQLVPVSTLSDLFGGQLEISSQHGSQALRHAEVHAVALDAYADKTSLRETVAKEVARVGELDREVASLRAAEEERARRLDFLQYQRQELEGEELDAESVARLEAEHRG